MEERLKSAIDRLLKEKQRVILAIDGNCASGKTTLAAELAREYDCNVLHMDDFFLRPEQRTGARLAEPGGNIDYERFRDEVLEPLLTADAFSFRPYDCSTGTLAETVPVNPQNLTVIEGSYSHHPYFGDRYDLRVFLSVDPQLQRARILRRPAFLHDRFFEEWIPMENRYFTAFSVKENSDIVLEAKEA